MYLGNNLAHLIQPRGDSHGRPPTLARGHARPHPISHWSPGNSPGTGGRRLQWSSPLKPRRSTFQEAAIPALQEEQRARGGIPAAPSPGWGVGWYPNKTGQKKMDLGSPLPPSQRNEEAKERTPAQTLKLDFINVVCHLGRLSLSLSHCNALSHAME